VDISYFSYITGIASLLGFTAQALDWFPKHKELRKFTTALLLGVFVGSLSTIFSYSHITFSVSITGFVLLLVVLGLKEKKKRGRIYLIPYHQ